MQIIDFFALIITFIEFCTHFSLFFFQSNVPIGTSLMWQIWFRENKVKICLYHLLTWIIHLVAQIVKHLPTRLEIWIPPLGREDFLEKEMATCSSILAWRIPRIQDPGGLQSMGSQRVRHDWATNTWTLSLKFLLWKMVIIIFAL